MRMLIKLRMRSLLKTILRELRMRKKMKNPLRDRKKCDKRSLPRSH